MKHLNLIFRSVCYDQEKTDTLDIKIDIVMKGSFQEFTV
jgi:hypothetical protein